MEKAHDIGAFGKAADDQGESVSTAEHVYRKARSKNSVHIASLLSSHVGSYNTDLSNDNSDLSPSGTLTFCRERTSPVNAEDDVTLQVHQGFFACKGNWLQCERLTQQAVESKTAAEVANSSISGLSVALRQRFPLRMRAIALSSMSSCCYLWSSSS